MKILFTVIWLVIFGLICIQPTPANITLDGTCVEKCLKDGHTINYCRIECTKFN